MNNNVFYVEILYRSRGDIEGRSANLGVYRENRLLIETALKTLMFF